MFFIPIGTDAPIYQWPFATLCTIILNSAIHINWIKMSEERQEWVWEVFTLRYGMWNPVQWVTSNYLHADLGHLIGNMIILWGIGIIVEGKVGWWKFLLLYNITGILSCGVEQTMLLFADYGASLGASRAIFGLLLIAMVWAPANELQLFVLIGWRYFIFDVTVYNYGIFCVIVEAIMGLIHFTIAASQEEADLLTFMCSAVLHMMGGAAGFGVGVLMLRQGWVDCENWDLFSVWKDRHVLTREQLAEERMNSEEGQRKLASARENMAGQFRNYMKADEPAAALAVHRRGKLQFADWRLPEPEHVQLISALRKAQLWDDTVLTMVEYLKTYSERAALVRLALAQLLVEQLSRPLQGLKVMARLDPKQLPPPQQQKLAALRERATVEAEDDPFEATVDDW
jgi:membrane associated rhomboid family serine protease